MYEFILFAPILAAFALLVAAVDHDERNWRALRALLTLPIPALMLGWGLYYSAARYPDGSHEWAGGWPLLLLLLAEVATCVAVIRVLPGQPRYAWSGAVLGGWLTLGILFGVALTISGDSS